MKPFVPARIVGDSVVAEDEPFDVGVVSLYRGVDLSAGRRVLVRQPGPRVRHDLHFRTRLQARARAQRLLGSSPIPQLLHAFGLEDQVCATVEEHVAGTLIASLLEALKARDKQLALPVVLAIGRAVAALFSRSEGVSPRIGLVVTPGRIKIDPRGAVRVLPKYVVETSEQFQGARSGVVVNKAPLLYMSPEEVMGVHRGPVDPQRSMFSFGVLLHELITGSAPGMADRTFIEFVKTRTKENVLSIGERRAKLPLALISFVDRCTLLDPKQRFESWAELTETLDAVSAWYPATGPREVLASVRTLVAEEPQPPLDPRALDGWEGLPHSGWKRIELGAAEEAPPEVAEPSPMFDPDAIYRDPDARPMYRVGRGLLVDARPVSMAEFERFLIQTGRTFPTHWEPAANPNRPARLVSVEDAHAFAAWAGKRLPSDAEWERAVEALGVERLATGEVWEWTASPHPDTGVIVRGGRWRDRPDLEPLAENRSCEVGPASDLGFRCVADE